MLHSLMIEPWSTETRMTTDARSFLAGLRRPRLLVRAARLGLPDYRRDRDLRRLLAAPVAPAVSEALPRLIAAEAAAEATRRAGDAGYSFARHIELLIAVLAETGLSAA